MTFLQKYMMNLALDDVEVEEDTEAGSFNHAMVQAKI